MRVFETEEKVNFVDDNNVLVGYDLMQCCCEDASWFITANHKATISKPESIEGEDFPGYNFDLKYDKDFEEADEEENGVIFRLVKEGSRDLFLVLHNTHNGYYSHGFEVKNGDKIINEGGL